MKKIISLLIPACVIGCVIGYSIKVPAIRIDGVSYNMDAIDSGVRLLSEERDSFYRELDESAGREIRSFLYGQEFIFENRLKEILQRKIDTAQEKDAVFQARFAALLNKNKLSFAIPLLQVRRSGNYDEIHASLFPFQLKSVTVNGAEFDEAAVTLIHEFTETRQKELSVRALSEIEQKKESIYAKMLENLNGQRPLDDEINIDDLVLIPADYHETASRLNAYNAFLLSQCTVSEQDKGYMLPVNLSAKKPIREEFMYENDFDKLLLKSFKDFHERISLGFKDYYRSGFDKIVSGQIEQMQRNLAEQRNIDREADIIQTTRFKKYINKQAVLYENMAYSILERSFGNSGTAVFAPVIYAPRGETAIHELSPLPRDYAVVNGNAYYEAPVRMMEQALASFTEYFISQKKMMFEREAQKISGRLISNINDGRDLNSGITTAGLNSLVKYYSDQASKTEFYAKLLEQFRADDVIKPAALIPASYTPEPEKSLFDSFRSVINVSLPSIDAEYYNELPLDQDAARIISAGIDAVRDEWNRVIPERKRDMIKNRLNQYQQNINARRNVKFGVSGAELKECIAWEERQQKISGYLFPSLIKSCSLNAKLPEISTVNPDVSAIDITPLVINAKIIDGMAIDSDLADGIENMAVILPVSMVETYNNEIRRTIQKEMDILRRNGAEYAKVRYELGTRIGLSLSELAEMGKSLWAKIRSREYQKKNPEAELYCSYILRDFNLEEELVQELYWIQKTTEDMYNALINDFIGCSLENNANYLITGAADPEKIINSNRMAIEYIKDVFQSLFNSKINVKFVKTDSMEELWGPVLVLEVGIGFIPGIGLLADAFINVCMDITACLVEKGLKKDEYAAKIVEIINIEERKLLQHINRYGGYK